MDAREEFVTKLIAHADARMLELGPLNRPILKKSDYPNCRYCDIRSAAEVKALYSGNAYLEATGITVDTESIVEIDDVITNSYSEHYVDAEKFDVIVASHVLEHMEDLIFSMRDIGGILKPGGLFCIVYPDKRYCFDHFRQSASFSEAYVVYHRGTRQNADKVLDFFLTSVQENSAYRYWQGDHLNELLHTDDGAEAIRCYEAALDGARMEDVHYWPFSDRDFLQFLYDGVRTRLLPFRCVDFISTLENDQQFMVALRYDPSVCNNPEEAMSGLVHWMTKARPYFYRSEDRVIRETAERFQEELGTAKQENAAQELRLEQQDAQIQTLGETVAEQARRLGAQEAQLAVLEATKSEQARKLSAQEMQLAVLEEIKSEQAARLKEQDGQIKEKIKAHTALLHSHAELTEAHTLLSRHFEEREAAHEEERLALQNRITALETIENSTIWRVSAPLRHLLDIIKGKH